MTTAGVIILGNTGVGKSFLGNVLFGQEVFENDVTSEAVTTETEYKECVINGKQYAVYNIPGLIEFNQDHIERNKREIDRAFKQHPYAVVVYVFGTGNGGRLQSDDLISFNAINEAYPLGEKSLVYIVNQIPKDRKSDYEPVIKKNLEDQTKIPVKHICFFTQINKSSTTEKETMRKKLVDTITSALPKTHTKKQEIHLLAAELPKLKKQIDNLQKQIEEERKENEKARKTMEDERKQHRLELEKERDRAFRNMERLQIRDSAPSPVPYFVPVPTISSSDSGSSRRPNPMCMFSPPGPLKNDGTPDFRYKANWAWRR